ncbi:MAG: Mov34/MPN/PAD-1 family protein [Promethearchaeota archaeon]
MVPEIQEKCRDFVVSLPLGSTTRIKGMRESAHPNEAVALMFGRAIDYQDRVFIYITEMTKIESILPSPSSFEIDPVDQFQAMEDAKSRELNLVGILHTHPGRQFVSASDEVYMRNADRFSRLCWIIAGEVEDMLEIGAYMMVEGEIREIPVDFHGEGKTL